MNQLLSCITTLCLCLLCIFTVVIHADTTEITETTTNVEIVNSSIEVQQQKESPNTSPTQTSPNNDPILPTSSLPSPTSIINNNNTSGYDKLPLYTCYVIGECVPCEVFEAKLEKYCHDFGNKEPVECQWDTPDESAGNSTYPNKGSLPKFQPCKRVKRLERTKYFEFQFINIFIAFTSCSILLWRRKKLAADGYRKLSRRIRGNAL
uniref:Protein JTB n=1 Tax=Anthurium amnicola TaxID=1678845 RepID=A0A1D1ZJS2_9ARAE